MERSIAQILDFPVVFIVAQYMLEIRETLRALFDNTGLNIFWEDINSVEG